MRRKYSASLMAAGVLFATLSPLHLVTRAANAAVSPAVTQKLENGATLVTRSDKIAPRVAISLLIRAGAAEEKNATAGWRQVLTGAMLRATNITADGKTSTRTTGGWQEAAEKWGGEFGATTGDDFIELWARGDSAFAPQLLQSLLDIASTPRLADEDIAWARRRALEVVGQGEAGVAQRATDAISKALYRDQSHISLAYALPDYGTFESLSNLSNEELRASYARYFVPSKFVISAAGDVDANSLRNVLGNWRATSTGTGESTLVKPDFAQPEPTEPIKLRERTAGDGWVFIAFRTPAPGALAASELAALEVLSAALDHPTNGRLSRRLVVSGEAIAGSANRAAPKEIAQQAAAQWTLRRWAGELIVFAQTDPQNVSAVQTALLSEIGKLKSTPLSASELQAAKNYARGRWATGREQPRERAFQAGLAVIWSSFPDSEWPQKLAAVTAADVQRAAQKYLQNQASVWVLPG